MAVKLDPLNSAASIAAPRNWPAIFMLVSSSFPVIAILPWYLWSHRVSAAAWIAAGVLLACSGLSITAGYHRLWSHRTYTAHPALKWIYAVFGGMALQNSILLWSALHRVHHRYVDDSQRDPYSARRGLWFSHVGWMLRNYPASVEDLSRVPDLIEDEVVMFQHRHYLWFALGSNFGIPIALGLLCGDLWGFVLITGFLRVVVSHHFTFFINSLAHAWGRQPYTSNNSARDNDLLALLTWGEGYHNFHHLFQWDYRNGVRWWQFDPTKWLIAACACLGLVHDRKRVPAFKIRYALEIRQSERRLQAREKSSLAA